MTVLLKHGYSGDLEIPRCDGIWICAMFYDLNVPFEPITLLPADKLRVNDASAGISANEQAKLDARLDILIHRQLALHCYYHKT